MFQSTKVSIDQVPMFVLVNIIFAARSSMVTGRYDRTSTRNRGDQRAPFYYSALSSKPPTVWRFSTLRSKSVVVVSIIGRTPIPWLAVSLIDIESRQRQIQGYRHLSQVRTALMKTLRTKPVIHKQATWWYTERAAANFN